MEIKPNIKINGHWSISISIMIIIAGGIFPPLAIPFLIALFVVRYRTIEITPTHIIIQSMGSTAIPRKSIESVELTSGNQIRISMNGGKNKRLSFLKDPKVLYTILLSE